MDHGLRGAIVQHHAVLVAESASEIVSQKHARYRSNLKLETVEQHAL